MTVRIEKNGPVWTIIHDRPEARNAMDPESADALTGAFLEFDADKDGKLSREELAKMAEQMGPGRGGPPQRRE